MEIKISLLAHAKEIPLPKHATEQSAGLDLHSAEEATINPSEIALMPLGICISIPEGYEAQIRPRSGIALKHGVTVLNSPGTIDSDYRGELMVLLINLGKKPFEVKRGDRIAQLVVARYERVSFKLVEKLDDTGRGKKGFGSTGL